MNFGAEPQAAGSNSGREMLKPEVNLARLQV